MTTTQQTAAPATPAAANVAGPPNYAGPVDASRYIIGPQDSLQVTVWKEPTLSGTLPVRPDGMISLVLVGTMAAGLTPMALGADISQRLKKYIQDPVFVVFTDGAHAKGKERGQNILLQLKSGEIGLADFNEQIERRR
jgi:polysaccharide biosynthesis/export protein